MTTVEEIKRQLAEINVKTMEERMERLMQCMSDNKYSENKCQHYIGQNIHRELVYERSKYVKLREELEQQLIKAKENEKVAEIQKKITREALNAEIRK